MQRSAFAAVEHPEPLRNSSYDILCVSTLHREWGRAGWDVVEVEVVVVVAMMMMSVG